jgi:hypothetical protein
MHTGTPDISEFNQYKLKNEHYTLPINSSGETVVRFVIGGLIPLTHLIHIPTPYMQLRTATYGQSVVSHPFIINLAGSNIQSRMTYSNLFPVLLVYSRWFGDTQLAILR